MTNDILNIQNINYYVNLMIDKKLQDVNLIIDKKIKDVFSTNFIEETIQKKLNILCNDWANKNLDDRFIGRCWNEIADRHLNSIIECPALQDKIIEMYKETPEGYDANLALEALSRALAYNGYQKDFIKIIQEKFLHFFNNNQQEAVELIVDSLAKQLKNKITIQE